MDYFCQACVQVTVNNVLFSYQLVHYNYKCSVEKNLKILPFSFCCQTIKGSKAEKDNTSKFYCFWHENMVIILMTIVNIQTSYLSQRIKSLSFRVGTVCCGFIYKCYDRVSLFVSIQIRNSPSQTRAFCVHISDTCRVWSGPHQDPELWYTSTRLCSVASLVTNNLSVFLTLLLILKKS